ncbi:MAG: DNA-3-methyladenine glycosylase [Chlamydiales bacterium]
MKLPLNFYLRDNVVKISQELLGCLLFTSIEGLLTGGKIIETEAYRGPEDRASHAYKNRLTKRNQVMFQEGGVIYVYLCYGIHSMLNIVTNHQGLPHAILIRAITPLIGINTMLQRRQKKKIDKTFVNGPGRVAQALGIDKNLNGYSLLEETIWIEKGKPSKTIIAKPRVGIDYAGQDALLPWRFLFK